MSVLARATPVNAAGGRRRGFAKHGAAKPEPVRLARRTVDGYKWESATGTQSPLVADPPAFRPRASMHPKLRCDALESARYKDQEPMSASGPSPPGWPSRPKLSTSTSPCSPGFRYWYSLPQGSLRTACASRYPPDFQLVGAGSTVGF